MSTGETTTLASGSHTPSPNMLLSAPREQLSLNYRCLMCGQFCLRDYSVRQMGKVLKRISSAISRQMTRSVASRHDSSLQHQQKIGSGSSDAFQATMCTATATCQLSHQQLAAVHFGGRDVIAQQTRRFCQTTESETIRQRLYCFQTLSSTRRPTQLSFVQARHLYRSTKEASHAGLRKARCRAGPQVRRL